MLVAAGRYTGDGASSRVIDTGLGAGVTIRAVFLKGFGNPGGGIMIISGMSSSIRVSGAPVTAITALGTDGTFTVNADSTVNTAAIFYDWVVLSDSDGAGDFTYGPYTGTGVAHNINCTINPALVIVKNNSNQAAVFRTSAHVGVNCSLMTTTANSNQRITALGSGTFTIGTNSNVNTSLTVYYFIAVAANANLAVATYSGNSTDNTDLTTALKSILCAWIKQDSASNTVEWRPYYMPDDNSTPYEGAAAARSDVIQRYVTSGIIDLGTNTAANATGSTYYLFAFGRFLPQIFEDTDVDVINTNGSTSQIVQVYIKSSGTGGGLPNLVFGTSGLTAYYSYNGDTASHAITLATMALGTWATGGFIAVDNTNMPGVYQFGIPNVALANGTGVDIVFQGAAGMLETRYKVQLPTVNLYPASGNVAANIQTWLGSAVNALISGRVDSTIGAVQSGVIAAASFASGALDAVWSTASRTLTAFAFSVTVGTNNDKTGYALSSAGIQAVWDALTSALTTVGSIGKLLVDNINATIASRSTLTQSQILSDATPFPGADIDAAISTRLPTSGYTAPLTSTQTAQAVLNAVAASYDTAGTIGEQINNAGSGGSSPTVQQIVDGVWDELSNAHLTPATMGYLQALIAAVYAQGIVNKQITVVDGFDSIGNLHITQFATYSIRANTQLALTVYTPTDPTAGDVVWTLRKGGAVAFAGTIINYDIPTSMVTVGLELTREQTGGFTKGLGDFTLSIIVNSVDVLQSVPYPNGILYVKDAADPL